MNQAKQIELIQTVHDTIENQTETVSGKTHQIPATRYTSKKQLASESKTLFQNFPIVVGAANALQKAGDYFLHDFSGIPILVVKGKDEQTRAFLNICRHRGVRLLEEKNGHIKKNIVCPYHAWSYDTAGCLSRIYHPEGFENVSAETHSLIELDCQVRIGLIFVLPNPKLKGKYNIDEYLKEVYAITEEFGFENWVPFKSEIKTNAFNWKLGIEAGLEAYHFKIAHAKTIGPYLFDCGGISVEENKLHLTYYIPKTAILKLKDRPKEDWNLRKYGNTLVHIFPNTTFLIMEDHLMVVPVFPTDEGNNIAESFLLIPKKATTKEEEDHFNLNYQIFWNAIEEDNDMTRLQQQSFNQFDGFSITVGSYEELVWGFEELVQKAIREELKLTDFQ